MPPPPPQPALPKFKRKSPDKNKTTSTYTPTSTSTSTSSQTISNKNQEQKNIDESVLDTTTAPSPIIDPQALFGFEKGIIFDSSEEFKNKIIQFHKECWPKLRTRDVLNIERQDDSILNRNRIIISCIHIGKTERLCKCFFEGRQIAEKDAKYQLVRFKYYHSRTCPTRRKVSPVNETLSTVANLESIERTASSSSSQSQSQSTVQSSSSIHPAGTDNMGTAVTTTTNASLTSAPLNSTNAAAAMLSADLTQNLRSVKNPGPAILRPLNNKKKPNSGLKRKVKEIAEDLERSRNKDKDKNDNQDVVKGESKPRKDEIGDSAKAADTVKGKIDESKITTSTDVLEKEKEIIKAKERDNLEGGSDKGKGKERRMPDRPTKDETANLLASVKGLNSPFTKSTSSSSPKRVFKDKAGTSSAVAMNNSSANAPKPQCQGFPDSASTSANAASPPSLPFALTSGMITGSAEQGAPGDVLVQSRPVSRVISSSSNASSTSNGSYHSRHTNDTSLSPVDDGQLMKEGLLNPHHDKKTWLVIIDELEKRYDLVSQKLSKNISSAERDHLEKSANNIKRSYSHALSQFKDAAMNSIQCSRFTEDAAPDNGSQGNTSFITHDDPAIRKLLVDRMIESIPIDPNNAGGDMHSGGIQEPASLSMPPKRKTHSGAESGQSTPHESVATSRQTGRNAIQRSASSSSDEAVLKSIRKKRRKLVQQVADVTGKERMEGFDSIRDENITDRTEGQADDSTYMDVENAASRLPVKEKDSKQRERRKDGGAHKERDRHKKLYHGKDRHRVQADKVASAKPKNQRKHAETGDKVESKSTMGAKERYIRKVAPSGETSGISQSDGAQNKDRRVKKKDERQKLAKHADKTKPRVQKGKDCVTREHKEGVISGIAGADEIVSNSSAGQRTQSDQRDPGTSKASQDPSSSWPLPGSENAIRDKQLLESMFSEMPSHIVERFRRFGLDDPQKMKTMGLKRTTSDILEAVRIVGSMDLRNVDLDKMQNPVLAWTQKRLFESVWRGTSTNN